MVQLRMRRPSLEALPPLTIPDGYGLRTFQAGDEAAWAAIMSAPGGIGSDWTVPQVREALLERPQFAADGLFFATCAAAAADQPMASAADQAVASAAAWWLPPEEQATGYVHMVAALPAHRGRGLGRLVTLATLYHLRARGFGDAVLDTDDFRLPAIRTYLGLGFVPIYRDDPESHHPARWSAIFVQLWAPRRPDGS